MKTISHPYTPYTPYTPSTTVSQAPSTTLSQTPSPTLSRWQRALALCLVVCSLIWTMAAKPCLATGPECLSLQGFTVLTEHDNLVIRAPIDIESREDMRHILRDGAQVLLTCTATLERERTLLPRSTVATSTAAMVLSYDPLSRQYVLSMPLPEELEQLESAQKEQKEQQVSEPVDGPVDGTAGEPEGEEASKDSGPDKAPSPKQEQAKQGITKATPLYSHRDFNALMDATLGRLRMPLCSASLIEEDEDYFATIHVELRHTKVPPWLSQTLFFWSWELVPSIEFTQALHGE